VGSMRRDGSPALTRGTDARDADGVRATGTIAARCCTYWRFPATKRAAVTVDPSIGTETATRSSVASGSVCFFPKTGHRESRAFLHSKRLARARARRPLHGARRTRVARQIWQATDDLIFDIRRDRHAVGEDQVIYNQDKRNERIAWTLYKDGVRSLSLSRESRTQRSYLPGCCSRRRIPGGRARRFLTLLWGRSFSSSHKPSRGASENAVPIERAEKTRHRSAAAVRRR